MCVCLVCCSLQLFLLLAIILAFFLLTTSISPHVQLGLYNKYLKQHRTVFALALLTVLLVGSIGAFRLVSAGSTLQVWQPAVQDELPSRSEGKVFSFQTSSYSLWPM